MSKKNKHNTKTNTKPTIRIKPARPVGPEDLSIGDYVTIVRTTYEFIGSDCDWNRRVEPSRVTMMNYGAGWRGSASGTVAPRSRA